jgi:hypothetical protein
MGFDEFRGFWGTALEACGKYDPFSNTYHFHLGITNKVIPQFPIYFSTFVQMELHRPLE